MKDASRKDTDSVAESKTSLTIPVLQKLTKLRESLSRKALYTDPVGFYRNEKNKRMEEHDNIHREIKPECALDNSDVRMMKPNVKGLKNTPCSLPDSTEISISSDSSLENVSKSLGFETPVDLDTEEEECLLEEEKTPDFVKKLDTAISCEPESNGNDKDIDVRDDQEPCIGLAGIDSCENLHQEQNINQDTNQLDDALMHTSNPAPIKMESQFLSDTDATYDSQLSQGNDELSSDSDDDLLSPPPFLYEKTSKPIVHTPEKITTPIGASPMSSPVKPVRNVMQELDEQKYRFSVNKLLKEKNRREVKNAALTKIEADLDAGIKKGGIKSITEMISEDETDSEVDGEL